MPDRLPKRLSPLPRLIDHSKLGRKVSEAEQDHIRELIFQNYRIIYLIRPDYLYIVS